MDTGCVELWFLDGSHISIDCTAVEHAYADNMYECSELDYGIYYDLQAYAELILTGELEIYLKSVTDYGMPSAWLMCFVPWAAIIMQTKPDMMLFWLTA